MSLPQPLLIDAPSPPDMCTLSWWHKPGCYGVFFNRDESVRRSAARPPAIWEEGGTTYLCPLDPDGGGTWIFANRAGIIGCLLNNYEVPHKADNPVSRGLLLKSLARYETIAATAEALEEVELTSYSGFHLFLFSGGAPLLYNWDGDRLSRQSGSQVSCPLTSSGYRYEEVAAYRRQQFRLQVDPESADCIKNIEYFHNYHDERWPAHSPLMVRADARTVSQSRVSVEPKQICFSYRTVDLSRKPQSAILTTLSRDA